jgi:hypothetical protein
VLGLRKQIGSNPCRISCAIGYYYDFAGTGQQIDSNESEHLAFCFGDIGVAWTEYLQD